MHLSKKLARILNNVNLLEAEIAAHEQIGISNHEQQRIIERCVIQLQIEMELFIRNFILDCATGKFSHSNGIIHSTHAQSFINRENACDFLLRKNKSRREPQWAIPKNAIDAATTLKLSNLSEISIELGVAPWEIDNLRFVRNFIAHRSKESALKLRRIGLASPSGAIYPVSIITASSPLGGKNYERWAGFIRGVARRLLQ
jgi:hypothetical protein